MRGHRDQPRDVAYSHDGRNLISVGDDATLRLWDVQSCKEIRRYKVNDSVRAVRPLPDNKTVALLFEQQRKTWIELWDVADGNYLRQLESSITMAVSPDGRRLAVRGSGCLELRDLASSKNLHQWHGGGLGFWTVTFAPDGKRVAAATPCRIYIWDTATGHEVAPRAAHDRDVTFVRFLPDGKTILTASRDGTVRLWEPATGKMLRHFTVETGLATCDLSPDGRLLAVPGDGSRILLWEVAKGQKVATWKIASDSGVSLVKFSPDGTRLAVSSLLLSRHWSESTSTLRLLDAATGKLLHNFGSPYHGYVRELFFSPDGKLLIAADASVTIWELASRKLLNTKPIAGRALFVLPGNSAIGVARGEFLGTGVVLCNMKTGLETTQVPEGPRTFFMGLTGDAKRVVLGPRWTGDAVLCLRQMETSKLLARLAGHRGSVEATAFSPDGQLLATGGSDCTVLLWHLPSLLKQQSERRAVLGAAELASLWTDLGATDPAMLLETIDRLVQDPDGTVALLQKKLSPVSAANLERWIADLDSPAFADRDQATRALSRMEFAAATALKRILAGQATLEVRRRAARLLDALQEPHVPAPTSVVARRDGAGANGHACRSPVAGEVSRGRGGGAADATGAGRPRPPGAGTQMSTHHGGMVVNRTHGRRWFAWGALAVAAVVLLAWWALRQMHPSAADRFPLPPIASSPFLNTRPDVRYVGSKACLSCHEQEHASFRHTGMGRSLAKADAASQPADGGFDHPLSKRRYRAVRKEGVLWHREWLLRDGAEVLLAEYPIKYVVGSGDHAHTYLIEDDGFLMESPMSWYAAQGLGPIAGLR